MARLEDEPIPVDKECPVCKEHKLLSEFDLAHKSSDKRAPICKTCEEEKRKADSEFCCDVVTCSFLLLLPSSPLLFSALQYKNKNEIAYFFFSYVYTRSGLDLLFTI